MSLGAKALTKLSRVKDELSISHSNDDGMLERMIEEASERFRRETNREKYAETTGYVEYVAGHGDKRLQINDIRPVNSVNSIEYDTGNTTTTVTSSEYLIEDADKGWIRMIDGSWRDTTALKTYVEPEQTEQYLNLYKIDYDGGYNTPNQSGTTNLPQDIERAVIEMTKNLYLSRQNHPNASMERIGPATIQYAQNKEIPAWDRAVSTYRDVAFA